MDFLEKIFGLISNRRADKQERILSQSQCLLADCEKSLSILIQSLTIGPIEIHIANRAGCLGKRFYFSPRMAVFSDPEKNRCLYQHQALVLAAASEKKIVWPAIELSDSERWSYFAGFRDEILDYIQVLHPKFLDFHERLKKDFETADLDRSQDAQSWLFWGGLPSAKTVGDFAGKQGETNASQKQSQKKDSSIQTEFEREEIDLEQQASNPVTHSFEKLETADDYQGGRRPEDGSDQMEEHARALEEVKLKKVTRSGESAAGFVQAEMISPSGAPVSRERKTTEEFVLYPEWDLSRQKRIPDFCRLYLQKKAGQGNGPPWRQTITKKYQKKISQARSRLLQIANEPRWIKNQLEGSEIDLEAYVRYHSDVQARDLGIPRLYKRQKKRSQEFQILILIDSSLSTDSFVKDHRVLDVALDSVGLMGLITENFSKNTIVARTFSETRFHCVFETLKLGQESWDTYFDRGAEVSPMGYTRLGPALRHSIGLLKDGKARQKFLFLLTDGKPTDYDGYEGRYGIEDIRRACLEAQCQGIFLKAFAIEGGAKNYFPQMFTLFELLDSPDKLPDAMVKTFIEATR